MQIKQIVKDFKLRGAGEFVVNKYPMLERGKILNYILIFTTNDYESNHHYHMILTAFLSLRYLTTYLLCVN